MSDDVQRSGLFGESGPISAFSGNSWDDSVAWLIGFLSWVNALYTQIELDDDCPRACDPVSDEPYPVGQRPDDVRRDEQIAFLQSLLTGLANLSDAAAEVYLTDQTPRSRQAQFVPQDCEAPASSQWLGREKRWNRAFIRLLDEIVQSAINYVSYTRAATWERSAPPEYWALLDANDAYLKYLVKKIESLDVRT